MAAFVEHVYSEPSIPPVIVIPEVGHFNSSNSLKCGMKIGKSCNRPTLKIFDRKGDIVEEEDITRKDTGKNYIILRNKKTNKVSIYGTKVTYLKKPDDLKMKTYNDQSVIDKNLEFNMVFGTKKAARLTKSRTNDTFNASTDIFENITPSSETLQSICSQSTNDFLIYLPHGCNRFSDQIETIYPISTLLHTNEIDLMSDFAHEVINAVPFTSDEYEDLSQFFVSSVNRLSHKSVQNICLITFADGLIELLKKKPKDLNSKKNNKIYPASEIINDKLLDNFFEYSVTGRDLTSKMKDKAICHLVIIMLLTNVNVIELNWLTPFIPQNSHKRLIALLKVVGVTPLKDEKAKYALKMPLATLPAFNKHVKRTR